MWAPSHDVFGLGEVLNRIMPEGGWENLRGAGTSESLAPRWAIEVPVRRHATSGASAVRGCQIVNCAAAIGVT
jgi:hypothetical protein